MKMTIKRGDKITTLTSVGGDVNLPKELFSAETWAKTIAAGDDRRTLVKSAIAAGKERALRA
jgi:hypothetical protein